jgi:hypothetical protein
MASVLVVPVQLVPVESALPVVLVLVLCTVIAST